jgi:hypothetical protein
MVKVAFVMLIYNDDYVLSPAIKAIRSFGQIYVAEGPVKYYQDNPLVPDGTHDILHSLIPNENIVHGQWPEKDEQCNAMLHLVPDDVTHIWEIDADEVWRPNDVRQILDVLEEVDSMSFRTWSFFGGLGRYMTGFEEDFEFHRIKRWYPGVRFSTHRPPTMLAPDGWPWREHNHWNHEKTDRMGWRIFHYSYVFPSQVKKKAAYYWNHDSGSQIANWYEDIYWQWVCYPERRKDIESCYKGVHNWRPSIRGECYTARFSLPHPPTIREEWVALHKRFNRELQ